MSKKNPEIEILMATYNGERYLEEQINSLLNQTYVNWKLKIRDDNSTDKTLSIIKNYQKKYPDKIFLMKDMNGNLGAKNSFLELLKNSKADYVMFCDQDDVWLDNKIEKTLKKTLEIEDGPTLVHTDLKVVDEKLNLISESFWKFQKIDPKRKEHNYLIVQNNITGCTMMLNKDLIELSKKNFPNGIMHDWIIAIIASLSGKIGFISEQTILYRQHKKNEVGAKGYFKSILKKVKNISQVKKTMYKTNLQLKDIYSLIEDEQLKSELKEYSDLLNKNFLKRKTWILRHRYLKYGLLRKISQLILF